MIHKFICDYCKVKIEDTDTKKIHVCPQCNQPMRWDLNFNCGQRGDYEHISESLAIAPSQRKEHAKHFPNVDTLPDGRIKFTSVKQQDDYLEKTGFTKVTQKNKNLGKKRIYP